VAAAGYAGPIEVEIFNEAIWAAPPDETAGTVRQRFPLAFAGVSGLHGRRNGAEPGGQAGRQARPS
jgi:hypothetical protein